MLLRRLPCVVVLWRRAHSPAIAACLQRDSDTAVFGSAKEYPTNRRLIVAAIAVLAIAGLGASALV